MTLPSSGPISCSQIDVELGDSGTSIISLGDADARALAGVPSGPISMSDFYGKSSNPGTGTMVSAKNPTLNTWGYSSGNPAYGSFTGTVGGQPLYALVWGAGTGGTVEVFTNYVPSWTTLKVWNSSSVLIVNLTGLTWNPAGSGIYYAAKSGLGATNPWPAGSTVYVST